MNHEPEPPSWLSGAAAVGTGAGPPNADQEAEEDHDGQAHSAGTGAADEDAPGFSDVPPDSDFGQLPADEPGFDEPGFDAPGGPPGFGQVPSASPGFGAAPDTDVFGGPGPAAPGPGPADPGYGPADPGYGAPAGSAQGSDHGPQGNFGAEYPGHYPGAYQGGGFGAAPSDGSFGGPDSSFGGPDGSFGSAPTGVTYGPAAGAAGYLAGQENGAVLQDQAPPLSGQYQPVRPGPAKPKPALRPSWGRRRSARRAARSGRQAQLTVARVEPWSVMKFSFVISLVAFIVLFVAVAVLYAVLSSLGVFDALQRTVESITSSQSQTGFNLNNYLSASRVLGYTGLLGAVNVVLITAISTVGAVLYNITADLAGGIEVTLKETD